MNLDSTKRTILWGIILGAIFGGGVGMGFGGGWSLINPIGLPMSFGERLSHLLGVFIFLGVGVFIGSIWGLFCSSLLDWKQNLSIFWGLVLIFNILAVLIYPSGLGGYFLLIALFAPPTLIGGVLLHLHFRLNRPALSIPLVWIAGFLFAYIPYSIFEQV